MSWLSIIQQALPLAVEVLPALAQVIVAVLHATGADKHKTLAGEFAGALQEAGDAASKLNKVLLNGAAPGAPQAPEAPPT